MIVRNSSNVWSPSGSPVFVEGVKLRAIMWGACGVPRGELIIVPNTSAAHTRVAPHGEKLLYRFHWDSPFGTPSEGIEICADHRAWRENCRLFCAHDLAGSTPD